ncbi:ribbon-helix-helix domain-containing protein [Enterococcus hermanniensis]
MLLLFLFSIYLPFLIIPFLFFLFSSIVKTMMPQARIVEQAIKEYLEKMK